MTTNVHRTPRPRPIGILAVSLLLAAGSFVVGPSRLGDRTAAPASWDAARPPTRAPAGPSAGAGFVPAPGEGPVHLPSTGSLAQIDHNIGAWTKNLQANSKDFLSATNLAMLYQARARLTADLADHERALGAARTAIAIAPTEPAARALEASILFSLHQFRAAFAAADALWRDDSSQLGALATRADAELELGDLDAAGRDLATLKTRAPGPAVDVRLARLAAVSGDLDGAVALARRARDAAGSGVPDAAFYAFALGEYARLAGDVRLAREGYETALASRAADLGALLGLARIEAYAGDVDDAIATLETAVGAAPTPEAEALLGDLLATRAADRDRSERDRSLDSAAADVAFGTVRLTRTLSALAGSVYDRQLLLFDLDHGPVDIGLIDAARASFADRPDSAGRDLVAWALHRLGRDREAWSESMAVRAAGAADARTLFHAGAIAAALGDAAAPELLGRALALGPALDPAERAEAASILAGLGAPGTQPDHVLPRR